jgi:hypothetical protein
MRILLLPFQPRFFVYTAVLLITAILLLKLYLLPSVYIVILLVLFGSLAIVVTFDLLQTGMRCCATIRCRRISASSRKKFVRRSANIFSKDWRSMRRSSSPKC